MKKIRAAVVGYGNIGKFTIQALEAAPDFEIAGVVRRNGAVDKPLELTPYEVVKDIKELKDVDVAILATPTRSCEEYAKQIAPLGINTVDSFDIHTQIRGYRERQMELNKKTNTVSVIVLTLSFAPSCRALLLKVSHIPTSVPACLWATAYACALRLV